jgi:hypothetical protein
MAAGRLTVGTRKGLFTIVRKNGAWVVEHAALLGEPVTLVLPLPDGGLLAAVEHGHFGVKLKRSSDGGKAWEERPAPRYPEKPNDVEDLDPIRHEPIPWDVKTVWALETGGPENADELWCGTIPGGLFHSTDAGESWSLVESLWQHPDRKEWFGGGADYPGLHTVLVDPRDSDVIRTAVSCGGVWISRDRGASWDCIGEGLRAAYVPPPRVNDPRIQDPHAIAQCRTAPDTLWMQHHNGIFRSTDGGESWTEIEEAGPSTFGFPVVADPNDPETSWFVPGVRDDARYPVDGKLVVTRTSDGGQSFETLTNGLPQAHAYDLVFRHALAIDDEGSTLSFGSSTGNLWISDDRGDSWSHVSGSLPPIYCVRFG